MNVIKATHIFTILCVTSVLVSTSFQYDFNVPRIKRQIQENNSDNKNDTTVDKTEETKLIDKNNRSLAAMESIFNRAGEKVTIEDILKVKNDSETKIEEKDVKIEEKDVKIEEKDVKIEEKDVKNTEESPKINKRSVPVEDISERKSYNAEELLRNYLKQLEKKYEETLSVEELKEEYLIKIRKYLKKYGTRLQEMLQKRRFNRKKGVNYNIRRKRDLLLLSEVENNPNNSDVSTSPSLSDKQLNPIFINPLLSNSSVGHHELIQKNDENKGDASSGDHGQSIQKNDENKGDASSGDHDQSIRKSHENMGDASSDNHGQSVRNSNENKGDASSGHHDQSSRKSDENKGDARENRKSTIEENNKSGPILKQTIKEDGTTLTTPFNKGENVNTGLFAESSTQFDSSTEFTTNNDN